MTLICCILLVRVYCIPSDMHFLEKVIIAGEMAELVLCLSSSAMFPLLITLQMV
jgi:hypothetical protein